MNYQNGKIYRLDCNITGEVYIGSTTQPTVAKRLAEHVASFKRWKEGKRNYVSSFAIIERNNYQITMIEVYPCNSRDELSAREGFYIRNINCINKRIEGRTQKEWREDTKESKTEYDKNYRESNKEQLKEYREANIEQITKQQKEYREANIEQITEQQKEYYEANKEKILEKKKVYYEARKEEIKIYQKQHREKKRLEKLQEKADLS